MRSPSSAETARTEKTVTTAARAVALRARRLWPSVRVRKMGIAANGVRIANRATRKRVYSDQGCMLSACTPAHREWLPATGAGRTRNGHRSGIDRRPARGVSRSRNSTHRISRESVHQHAETSVIQLPKFGTRSEEHTSELQSLMRISYAV